MTELLSEQSLASVDQREDLVSYLYKALLGRDGDMAGVDNYVNELGTGLPILGTGLPIKDLIKTFLASEEFQEKQRSEARRILLQDSSESQTSDISNVSAFPQNYAPPGEAGRSYLRRRRTGFLDKYCSGSLVLDVGFTGYANPDGKPGIPGAIGIDLNYPGYDGHHLPFPDGSVDTVFSSHCLEHIIDEHEAIQDWHRVLKVGGFIVCMVPSQALYEKRRSLPSRWNADHKRMYSPSTLLQSFEEALVVNSYRVRHLAENDIGFDYTLGPDVHSKPGYEIELVVEKIATPDWTLD